MLTFDLESRSFHAIDNLLESTLVYLFLFKISYAQPKHTMPLPARLARCRRERAPYFGSSLNLLLLAETSPSLAGTVHVCKVL